MKTHLLIFLVVANAFSFSQETTSFDFLNMSPTASRAAYGFAPAAIRGSIEGLWGNPAGTAGLQSGGSCLVAHNFHAGINLISAATLFGFGAFQFGGGASLLLPGDIQSGLSLNNVDASLQAQDLLFLGNGAVRLGDLLHLPFHFDLGTSINFVNETLSTQNISALFFDVGMILGFKLGNYVELNLGSDVRHLGVQISGNKVPLPQNYALGVELTFCPSRLFLGSLLTQVEYLGVTGSSLSFGSEIKIAEVLSLKGGLSFNANVISLSVGGGIQFNLGGSSKINIETAFTSKEIPDGEMIYQASFEFNRLKQLAAPATRETIPTHASPPPLKLGLLMIEDLHAEFGIELAKSVNQRFANRSKDQDNLVILGRSEATWLGLQKEKYAELANAWQYQKLIVVLKNQEDDGNALIFLINAESGEMEYTAKVPISTKSTDTVTKLVRQISQWKI